MYSMKETCKIANLSYDTLKYYCNEGLIPNVKRDNNNYRIFDEDDINWIKSLSCIKKCGMTISEMKEYINLCFIGDKTILERKEILENKQKQLFEKLSEIKESIDFIDKKQKFYDNILLENNN